LANSENSANAGLKLKEESGPRGKKSRIFLIDAMSFIFRAYHAMQRQRPMSTKNGVPTAATYVFVNMLNKLRKDFAPEYLAAVFDVSAPTFRDAQAAQLTSVKKFNIKTQQFEKVEYGGYKAHRDASGPRPAGSIYTAGASCLRNSHSPARGLRSR